MEQYIINSSNKIQLIHGDPRIESILFSKEGIPDVFIDFDTFMLGSVDIDIGDCLRLLILVDDEASFSKRIQSFVNGYQEEAFCASVSYKSATNSLKYITLELTLRFIIDVVEQKFFRLVHTYY